MSQICGHNKRITQCTDCECCSIAHVRIKWEKNNKFDTIPKHLIPHLLYYLKNDNICFVLDNIYKIEMLGEPILKYFLIKSVQIGSIYFKYVIPKEIFVYVMQLYMELDYKCTDDITNLLAEIA